MHVRFCPPRSLDVFSGGGSSPPAAAGPPRVFVTLPVGAPAAAADPAEWRLPASRDEILQYSRRLLLQLTAAAPDLPVSQAADHVGDLVQEQLRAWLALDDAVRAVRSTLAAAVAARDGLSRQVAAQVGGGFVAAYVAVADETLATTVALLPMAARVAGQLPPQPPTLPSGDTAHWELAEVRRRLAAR